MNSFKSMATKIQYSLYLVDFRDNRPSHWPVQQHESFKSTTLNLLIIQNAQSSIEMGSFISTVSLQINVCYFMIL